MGGNEPDRSRGDGNDNPRRSARPEVGPAHREADRSLAGVHILLPHQLPDTFPASRDPGPGAPSRPLPAATVALLRNGQDGSPEVLLLRRSRGMGFIPGAYVFPGGSVEPGDGHDELSLRMERAEGEDAPSRMAPPPGERGSSTHLPPQPYFVAALREAFEEVGLVLGSEPERFLSAPRGGGTRLGAAREELLAGRVSFREVLEGSGLSLDTGVLRYIGHWVTPEEEPRRFDTRFFAMEVPGTWRAYPDRGEIAEAIWLTPREALRRNLDGRLPMVFPTMMTLEALLPFATPARAMEVLGSGPVPRLLPRLVSVPDGVGILL